MHPITTMRNSGKVGAVREGFREEVTLDGSQRMRRQPEKSVGSVPGRGLEACNSTTFGLSATNCELKTGNAVGGGVGGEPGKGKAQGSYLGNLDSTPKV